MLKLILAKKLILQNLEIVHLITFERTRAKFVLKLVLKQSKELQTSGIVYLITLKNLANFLVPEY